MTPKNIQVGDLTDKLHELLVVDLDFKNSEINKFLNVQLLNLILTSLSAPRRLEFYKLLGENNYESAKTLVLTDIPNFHQKLLSKIKDKFQEIL